MPRTTLVKLVLAIAGLLLFAVGVRQQSEAIRWAAIVVVAIAFLLRFVKPEPPGGST